MKRLIGAAEVADRLGVSRSTAYSVIRTINREMESKGKRVIAGKVDECTFESLYVAGGKGADDVSAPR